MRIEGLVFVGTRTEQREAMARFVGDVLGLSLRTGHGLDAEVFELPDGSAFAVTSPDGPTDVQRTVGFRVGDVGGALEELRAAGLETDEIVSEHATQRYVHFRAPDGRLYELVQDLT
jgi:glyoxylase I family protein